MSRLTFALALSLMASCAVATSPLDYQETFQRSFVQTVNAIRDRAVFGIQFQTPGTQEKATFHNILLNLKISNATIVPETTKVLESGAAKEYTIYQQKFTIVADGSADFVGTLDSGKDARSHVFVNPSKVNIGVSVNHDDDNGFKAIETEPWQVLLGSKVELWYLPEGVSPQLMEQAKYDFLERINTVIKTAIDSTVQAINRPS